MSDITGFKDMNPKRYPKEITIECVNPYIGNTMEKKSI